jgi:hypothetical protein
MLLDRQIPFLCEGRTSPRRGRWRQRIDHASRGLFQSGNPIEDSSPIHDVGYSSMVPASRITWLPEARLEDQHLRVQRVSAISCAARRKHSRGTPRTSPITGIELESRYWSATVLVDRHLRSTTGSDGTSSAACRNNVLNPYHASKR